MRGLLGLALIISGAARAADVDRFEPAGSTVHGHGTLQGEAPWLGEEGISAGLLANFAQDPVTRVHPDGSRTPEVAAMLPFTLYGGYTWGDKARFEAFLPVYGWVDAPMEDFRGAAVGDVRLQANVPVYDDDLVVSIVPRVGLPTGGERSLTRRGMQGSFLLALAHQDQPTGLGFVANVGVTGSQRSDLGGIALGSTFDALVGGWWNASHAFRVGTEIDLRAGLVQGEVGGSTTSAWHSFAQALHPTGLGLTVGGGTTLLSDVGAPAFRAYAAVSWAPRITDHDLDGVLDHLDICPSEPEDADGFEDADGCPDPDNDGDGIGDFTDQCDDAPEDLDGFQDGDGCPDPDNDGDALSDADDLCPDHPGPTDAKGCPDTDDDGLSDADDLCPTQRGPEPARGCPDADGDRVGDYRDACPDVAGPLTELLDHADGCAKPVWLAGDQRVGFAEPLAFVTDGAVMRPTAKATVAAIAGFLKEHPQLLEIEIQGHLDDTAEEQAAIALTQARAEAVLQELTRHGVEPARLVAKGYGKTKPVDTNRTEAGRANNRRIELHILRMEPIAAPEWPAPPGASEAPRSSGTPSPDAAPGTLEVRILGGGWGDVFIDGDRIRLTAPFASYTLPAGPHQVRVTNREDIEHTQDIVVAPGEHLVVEVAPAGLAPVAPADKPDAFDGSFPLFPEAEGDSPFDGNFPIFADDPGADDARDDAKGKKKRKRGR